MRNLVHTLIKDEGGQAFVEYILGLSMAVVVVAAMARSLRSTLWSVWKGLAKEVAAPCAGCRSSITAN